MKKIRTPIEKRVRVGLKAGEAVLLSGMVYTARDAAHKRLIELLKRDKKLPVNLKDAAIYYTGPTPKPPGRVIGSCGPTTSSRMDPFTVPLLKKGLGTMIGKGRRSVEIRSAIKKFGAVYFAAPGGAGALLSKRITKQRVICFKELGPEAIHELELKDFPVIVAVDSRGRSVYERRRKRK